MSNDSRSLQEFCLKQQNPISFQSVGNQGVVLKMIVFVRLEGNRWNVGFGDVVNSKIDDAAFTNNNDVLKVISTVAHAIYTFSEAHPNRVIVINPVDYRRKRFYNMVFQRHWVVAAETFDLWGFTGEAQEPYSSEKFYDGFELTRKFEI